METVAMGKVLVAARIENLFDLEQIASGKMPPEQLRSVEVDDARVDTGASTLLLPTPLIKKLGLKKVRTREARGIGGRVKMDIYGTVRLTIQGRDCVLDVGEISADYPVLIGQIPLELLDWVVDPANGRLIGNPEHGGEAMIDVFTPFE